MIKFQIHDAEYIEMMKLLKAAGLCSTGGEAGIMIVDGQVKYNGAIDTRKRLKVRKGDKVEYNGETIVVD